MPFIEVSWGELVDRITILEIKNERLKSAQARAKVGEELNELWRLYRFYISKVFELKLKLKQTNELLWDVEDKIRDKEAKKSFDGQFIRLARMIYENNDYRSGLKTQINLELGSRLTEQKQYTPYAEDARQTDEESAHESPQGNG